MMKDNRVYLRHMLDAVTRIEDYTRGLGQEGFMKSPLVQAGVVRELEIIGEAAKRIDDGFRAKYPEIPWKRMTGARDKLIHQYFGVDLQVIWDTVESALPDLKTKIERILREEG